ncbi:MAG: ferritin family protein [Candidatus Brocadiia bacterium]
MSERTDRERLQEALKHEEHAVKLYREFERDSEDERLKEMFEQFAMNESWHAAALRAKLEELRD